MLLKSLEAHDFRNLRGRIFFTDKLNILYGNNGQGKTNWLEAIYLLAQAKSFRTRHLDETIRFGTREASITGTVSQGKGIERELEIRVDGNRKQMLVNGKREPVGRYSAHLQAVCFTANELEVVRGGSEARRSFLDRGAASLQPSYIQTIVDYNRVIKQKKRLLQQAAEGQFAYEEMAELIDPWNQQLIHLSAQIHKARTEYVDQLNAALDHRLFSDDISMRYVSSLEDKGDLSDYESLIAQRLEARKQAEIHAGACLIGPHRDDLDVHFGGRNLRTFGSSGQQRSALITLDLAAISVYHSKRQDYPIFLIDDLDAELDGIRIERLLEYLEGRTQTFVTTSKRSHFGRFARRANFYEISEGAAREERSANAATMGSGNVI